MAKLSRKKGITSQILHVFIQDSSSTAGAGLTGLAYTGAGITPTVKYINAGGTLSAAITLEDITTLGTYQAPTANTNMRFKEVSSASPSQGIYEIHLHNDWMNLTGGSLVIMMAGATNMAQFRLEIDLQADVNVTHVAGTAQTAGDLATMITAVDDFIDTEVAAILVDTGTTLENHLTDIKGATFNGATDSLEAIRDRGDAAWVTGAGGSDRLLMVDTTIATLASQTSFTLTAGSADNNAYVNCTIVIEDVSTATQKAVGLISAYTGSTKTVTLKYDPAIFTMAATDKVYILAENSLKTTAQNRQLDVTATGAAGIDWGNVENPTTAVDLSATDIQLCDTTTTNTDMRGTNNAALASVCTETRLSELDAATVGKMANQVDVIETDTTANLDAAISSRATPAQVNTEVLDVLNTDTFAEPGQGAPAATTTLIAKINYIYKFLRNKIVTSATEIKVYDDAGTTVDQKSTIADDATNFTRGEFGSGP